ncbi:MAG TPA: pantothenate kinase [Cyanobacteria bacterium UBA11149]|nr:pantothenate kinase [Cyanobacteria bacterium UBA11367]HBE56852.1 pantothenate kinase [Cyanobacteria bacterium UBA11366]HBK65122.1 pantothenate kinase [Cyanobacteria bacterium UBA11166]HBS67986.1 pantothenate kinase [Cyanobacteria bacterium UBA11153]HBW91245.1 pantothenate kinase [Cyanobacteria bacterium UBA11149]HCA95253.1 pantothenate kinase [Cyanobacteria bacterium UBA9226]
MLNNWLALIIGNSRLHWAWFMGTNLQETWDTNHLPAEIIDLLIQGRASSILPGELLPSVLVSNLESQIPLYIASVVPAQTKLWKTYPQTKIITLDSIPLLGLYPTLGIDRALALLGGGETYGYPILVIDGGTALTFTGADGNRNLIGGAILPGLRLQLESLSQGTGLLPAISLPTNLPPRWAKETTTAIASGVLYTVLAGIRDFISDWYYQFPESKMAITGGDANWLLTYLEIEYPEIWHRLTADSRLIFFGIESIVFKLWSSYSS